MSVRDQIALLLARGATQLLTALGSALVGGAVGYISGTAKETP